MNYLIYSTKQPCAVVTGTAVSTPFTDELGQLRRFINTHQAAQMVHDRARMGAQEVWLQDRILLNTEFNVWQEGKEAKREYTGWTPPPPCMIYSEAEPKWQ